MAFSDREMDAMRALVKSLVYRLGVARRVHRWRNRGALTVVMFHRVLPPEDPRFVGANPAYTVTVAEFQQCLDHFARYYSVVSLMAVEAAAAGGEALPPCPLLITFDDGWQDNAAYALPPLRARGMPALLFVATGHIGRDEGFWQEEIFDRIAAPTPGEAGQHEADAAVEALLQRPPEERAQRLAALPPRPLPRRMADATELRQLEAAGVCVGGHGHVHDPMTEVVDAVAECATARQCLRDLGLGGDTPAFSFPHGRWTPELVAVAQRAGFGLCFTSAPELTSRAGLRAGGPLGRIAIDMHHWRGAGEPDMAGFALSLILRPRR